MVQNVTALDARLLFLRGLGLLEECSGRVTPARTLSLVRRLGFVQLDSINIVERAHHHVLWSRLHSYRPSLLDGLHRSGKVFEHWTHDASLIPSELFPHWRHRFARVAWGSWLQRQMGPDHARTLEEVIERVRREGPVLARDFERAGTKGGPWWDWKPAKAALEYWWRTGELAVAGRGGPGGFEKIYDLSERVLPEFHGVPAPDLGGHVAWACATALDRLGIATAREISAFWALITPAQASAWGTSAVASGEAERVRVEPGGGKKSPEAFGLAGWRDRAARAHEESASLPPRLVILSPFDPLIRDRARCLRLFGFHYRFEAFVPRAKRVHGYYVLPVLEFSRGRARFVARVDPELDRDSGVLTINRVWWEAGAPPTAARQRALERALGEYAAFVGAARWRFTESGVEHGLRYG